MTLLDTSKKRLILHKSVTRYELNVDKCFKKKKKTLEGFRIESPVKSRYLLKHAREVHLLKYCFPYQPANKKYKHKKKYTGLCYFSLQQKRMNDKH